MTKSVLFLGYDEKQTRLIDSLKKFGTTVVHSDYEIPDGDYGLVISYGFNRILKHKDFSRLAVPVLNLHISYLPFNRGKHPNFWSFYDQTPAGVTIHIMDGGIDTGPILYQRKVEFDADEITFEQTYCRLRQEIENLFEERISDILSQNWNPRPQKGLGSLHFEADLPKQFRGWNTLISAEIPRLKRILSKE